MTPPSTGTLRVDGASLYYEARGSGPVLLLIPGGNGDAGPYLSIVDQLADRYTVVNYDRRGFSRSVLDEPPDDRRAESDVADAVVLLDRLGDGPGYVFGSSSGAIVALELMARHPERVRRLVAHEPPAVRLLPDSERYLAFLDEVYEDCQRLGIEAGMRKFVAEVGFEPMREPPPGVQLPQPVLDTMARAQANLPFWVEHELRVYTRIMPDVEALRAVADRIVLAGGRESRQFFPYRPNVVLAERLGTEVVDFPGGHIGYATEPAEFATRLGAVLSAPDEVSRSG